MEAGEGHSILMVPRNLWHSNILNPSLLGLKSVPLITKYSIWKLWAILLTALPMWFWHKLETSSSCKSPKWSKSPKPLDHLMLGILSSGHTSLLHCAASASSLSRFLCSVHNRHFHHPQSHLMSAGKRRKMRSVQREEELLSSLAALYHHSQAFIRCPHMRSQKNNDIYSPTVLVKELTTVHFSRPRFCATHPEWMESRANWKQTVNVEHWTWETE